MTIGDDVLILIGDAEGKRAQVVGLGEQHEFPLVYVKIRGERKPDIRQYRQAALRLIEEREP